MRYTIYQAGQALTVLLSQQVEQDLDQPIFQRERASLDSRLRHLAEIGYFNDEHRFVNEGDGVYAIKTQRLRLYGFFDRHDSRKAYFGAVVVKKGRQKLNTEDRRRVVDAKRRYQQGEDHVNF